jgi:hypothetical protein
MPIHTLCDRVDEIRIFHEKRLNRVLDLCATPHTINKLSSRIFGDVQGYNVLLALGETGAHVEYLYQSGQLEVANLEEIEKQDVSEIIYKRI